jgi:hypothetical protein
MIFTIIGMGSPAVASRITAHNSTLYGYHIHPEIELMGKRLPNKSLNLNTLLSSLLQRIQNVHGLRRE